MYKRTIKKALNVLGLMALGFVIAMCPMVQTANASDPSVKAASTEPIRVTVDSVNVNL